MPTKIVFAGLAVTVALGSTPALAGQYDHGGYPSYPTAYPAPMQASFPIDRALAERCGLRAGAMRPHLQPAYYDDGPYRRDNGLGGALIGGVVGGVVGNRIAGRGDRVIGTVAGAAVGAAAGAAIDRAEDRGPEPQPYTPGFDYGDECEAALPPGYMLVSVPGGAPDCRDEVVTREEWVPEYVTVPAAPLREKRTKLRRVK